MDVSAVASNANADMTTMQTWMWNVAEVSPAFTTADAVIPIEVAVDSRPYYDAAEVSGDGRVTALDALRILQAARGGITI